MPKRNSSDNDGPIGSLLVEGRSNLARFVKAANQTSMANPAWIGRVVGNQVLPVAPGQLTSE